MDADFTALDDWLGTLEELQLGLEKSYTKSNGNGHHSKSDHRTFNSKATPGHSALSPGDRLPPTSRPARQTDRFHRLAPSSTSNAHDRSSGRIDERKNGHSNVQPSTASWHRTTPANYQECTVERDLSSLLRELEEVEETTKELEQEDASYTRRYSLASNGRNKQDEQPSNILAHSTMLQLDQKAPAHRVENQSFTDHRSNSPNPISSSRSSQPYSQPHWSINGAGLELSTETSIDNGNSSKESSPSPLPPPPAFLGAGDACASPPTSPPPTTPSDVQTTLISLGLGGGPSCQQSRVVARSLDRASSIDYCLANAKPRGLIRPAQLPNQSDCHGPMQSISNMSPGHPRFQSPRALFPHYPARLPSPVNPGLSVQVSNGEDSPYIRHHQPARLLHNQHSLDPDTESNWSQLGSWSPGQPAAKAYLLSGNTPPSSLSTVPGNGSCYGSDVLSTSLSPESSLSDKSLTDVTADAQARIQYNNIMPAPITTEKRVVRVFRPDRTTKAVLVDNTMTCGDVASLLIEKNFLSPSIALSVVEKVPSLKVERVFEEHENLMNCISAWPNKSQNMIFLEEREDLFGFIDTPIKWFGNEFANLHRYTNRESVQSMLAGIDQTGLVEWKDYLYVRKPDGKSWSRCLCVLRRSGLYTFKKGKKSSSSPSDLIRILVLEGPLELYTTTGGWSRMRAPTPHGFAFKPYSSQDHTAKHVYCFCATDEQALRRWVCLLRIAKFGKQLLTNYQTALNRVHRLASSHQIRRQQPGPASALIQRKSSFELMSPVGGALTSAESTSSLVLMKTPSHHQWRPRPSDQQLSPRVTTQRGSTSSSRSPYQSLSHKADAKWIEQTSYY